MSKLTKIIAIALCILFAGVADFAEAKGGRGGGFSSRSSSSSRSWSSSRPSIKATPSRSTPRPAVKSAPSSTTVRPGIKTASPVKTTQQSRAKARESFIAKNKAETKPGGKYTSQYKTEPAKRPSHIPETYSKDGKTYNVTYNQNQGGYGYWSGGGPGLGTFMMYDMMSDMAMISMLSASHSTHNHTHTTTSGTHTTVTHQNSWSFWDWLFLIVMVLVIIGMLGFIVYLIAQDL